METLLATRFGTRIFRGTRNIGTYYILHHCTSGFNFKPSTSRKFLVWKIKIMNYVESLETMTKS